jgi:hypothetical protein
MRSQDAHQANFRSSLVHPAAHLLHECRDAIEFCECFERFTGRSVHEAVHLVVKPSAPRALFLTGSIPLGMATHGSDVDLVVLVDDRDAMLGRDSRSTANTDQQMIFSNESDVLRAEISMTMMAGMTVEVIVVIASSLKRIYNRLRSRGPELAEHEIMILGRLRTGWLLGQTEGYLQNRSIALTDPALDIYCSTRDFALALIYRLKATRALELSDIHQALHLARLSVEMSYLAYFASQGIPYLGAKWLAQLGHARGAAQRIERHPLLKEGIRLLFPAHDSDAASGSAYLQAICHFLTAMRALIERDTLFRIAFNTCPQISPL